MSGQGDYKEFGYRKTAWILDDLPKNIKTIYQEKGIKVLKQLKGIGEIKAKRIEESLKKY